MVRFVIASVHMGMNLFTRMSPTHSCRFKD